MRKFSPALFCFPLVASMFFPLAANARCGLFDITCDPRDWCPTIGGCTDASEDSTTPTVTDPTYYEFEIRNGTRQTIYYVINQHQYSLPPGYRQSYVYPRTSGSMSGGGEGERSYVQIRWDGQYAPGAQVERFTLPFDGYDYWYEFRATDRIIYLY